MALLWRSVQAKRTMLSQMPSASLSLPDVKQIALGMLASIGISMSRKTDPAPPANLKLKAASYYLPKKNPKMPLGQDAHFIYCWTQTIGVADGVGGSGRVDSGVYARQLMTHAHNYVKGQPRNGVDPMRALEAAFRKSNAGGSSTACIITVKGKSLHAVNLGDSGFRVIRGEKTVYKSPVQQKWFNHPFQLRRSKMFSLSRADKIVVDVEPGDVLVAGTDGLFDNLFDAEIEEIVKTSKDSGKPAEILGKTARAKSRVQGCDTPFSLAATENGYSYSGGKYDDVTVIVGYIY